jgi:hypothetical protein
VSCQFDHKLIPGQVFIASRLWERRAYVPLLCGLVNDRHALVRLKSEEAAKAQHA